MIGLTMRELRQQVATLPDHTAIVYTAIYSDGEGTYYPPADALAFIAETANRPVVVPAESNIGRGGIGGFVMIPSLIGESVGELALRVLNGESAATIPTDLGNVVRPVFDWRQMQRWGIRESSLPPGSEIRFREVTAWDQYRDQILFAGAAILLQAALIAWLLLERHRRQRAEIAVRDTISNLVHVNRAATAGELTASIAHEVNQPLAAMVANANAGARWLAAATPDIGEAEAAFKRIIAAGHHAGDVVATVRSLFKQRAEERVNIRINDLIHDALSLERIELQ